MARQMEKHVWKAESAAGSLLHLVSVFFYVFVAYLHPASFQKELETVCILKLQAIA